MPTVPPVPVSTPLPPPHITQEWVNCLEYWAAQRGLPPDPWPLPHPREKFARWCADLEAEAAARSLPPEPWPL